MDLSEACISALCVLVVGGGEGLDQSRSNVVSLLRIPSDTICFVSFFYSAEWEYNLFSALCELW